MISIKILIITGEQSFSILQKIASEIKKHDIQVIEAPVSISAFITKSNVSNMLKSQDLAKFELVLLPGFVQWDSTELEQKFSINIRKGPEFASDLPSIIQLLPDMELSPEIPANHLIEKTGMTDYEELFNEQFQLSKKTIDHNTFYINESRSNVMISKRLPPPIIAEIVNCTKKSDLSILKKVKHYMDSGANIIDIGCVANKPNPKRVEEIIDLVRNHHDILISIDSMDTDELKAGIRAGADLILSLDEGNYENFLDMPRSIPLVILPTNISKGFFPKDPIERVERLIDLTKKLRHHGFKKIIADPLLETPIAPGICTSLEAYFLYKRTVSKEEHKQFEVPLFFGISNVVELMDFDSIGINGLLASIAIELNIGILFTVEHSTKLMNGVLELRESVRLNYLSKHRKSPPINQGIQYFKAKGKTSQAFPGLDLKDAILVSGRSNTYQSDPLGYFKIFVDHYGKQIRLFFFSCDDELHHVLIGTNAEALSKKVIELNLTKDLYHLNYLGRELAFAETCLSSGKPYIQDKEDL